MRTKCQCQREVHFRISTLPAECPPISFSTVGFWWKVLRINVSHKALHIQGSTNLSPCGGMGLGPWPLGRSIRGESGGRPRILLSRPEKQSPWSCEHWMVCVPSSCLMRPMAGYIFQWWWLKNHQYFLLITGFTLFLSNQSYTFNKRTSHSDCTIPLQWRPFSTGPLF